MFIPKTLREAVNFVIKQNKEVGYIPHRFISITKDGNIEDLEQVINRLVLKPELLEELEEQIKKHPDLATIEDLITESNDGFNLSSEVIKAAKATSERFNQIR